MIKMISQSLSLWGIFFSVCQTICLIELYSPAAYIWVSLWDDDMFEGLRFSFSLHLSLFVMTWLSFSLSSSLFCVLCFVFCVFVIKGFECNTQVRLSEKPGGGSTPYIGQTDICRLYGTQQNLQKKGILFHMSLYWTHLKSSQNC